MSKEQLEVFKNVRYLIKDNDRVSLCRDSFDFLIEQAERVQELEERLKVTRRHLQQFRDFEFEERTQKECFEKENKRYRESINLALNHIHTGNFNLATVELNKALYKEVEK